MASVAQATASRSKRSTKAPAARPTSHAVAGTGVRPPSPTAVATVAPSVAHSSTTDRSCRPSTQNSAVLAAPRATSCWSRGTSRWMRTADAVTGARKAPRWKSTFAAAGACRSASAEPGRPATSSPPLTSASAPSFTPSGIWSHRTATNVTAAANNKNDPVAVTQTAPAREGSEPRSVSMQTTVDQRGAANHQQNPPNRRRGPPAESRAQSKRRRVPVLAAATYRLSPSECRRSPPPSSKRTLSQEAAQSNPWSTAYRMSSCRRFSRSFPRMFRTWFSTVFGEMWSSSPISL